MIRHAAVLPCVVAVTCACAAWLSARAYGVPLPAALAVAMPALLIAIMRTRPRVPRTGLRAADAPAPGPRASTEALAGTPSSSPAAEAPPAPRRAGRGARYKRELPPHLIRRH